ncbi:uncharacterized protein MCYG_01141 [Microsporum canis CBS 113480]|uniref:Uncharacterized protein n=1 Tax=Arthroderma otae (strain ATCC MYA-4605 / CBS 113480) TaxID=554155 RepID=C5FEV9_ARTOC|nr:uncharacterized protein MCYG_01141 [Microsporum canis CBS 113480]EEQ28253.1 predicted protein [Microsporum canis CBS 113480]
MYILRPPGTSYADQYPESWSCIRDCFAPERLTPKLDVALDLGCARTGQALPIETRTPYQCQIIIQSDPPNRSFYLVQRPVRDEPIASPDSSCAVLRFQSTQYLLTNQPPEIFDARRSQLEGKSSWLLFETIDPGVVMGFDSPSGMGAASTAPQPRMKHKIAFQAWKMREESTEDLREAGEGML